MRGRLPRSMRGMHIAQQGDHDTEKSLGERAQTAVGLACLGSAVTWALIQADQLIAAYQQLRP